MHLVDTGILAVPLHQTLGGEIATAKTIIREGINATVGFAEDAGRSRNP